MHPNFLYLDGETNPSYESDQESDSFEEGNLRKDTAPAIQSTVLPWKRGADKSDESNDARNNKTKFVNTMDKPIKQQEFPPHWTSGSAVLGDEAKSSTGQYENES